MKENFLKFKWSTIILSFLIISNNCLTASNNGDEESKDFPSVLVIHNPAPDNDDEKSSNPTHSSGLQGTSNPSATDRNEPVVDSLSIEPTSGAIISTVLIPAVHSLAFILACISDQSRELAVASMVTNSAYALIYTGSWAILPKRSNPYLTALTIIGGTGGLTTSGFSAAYLMTANNAYRLVNTGLNAAIGVTNLVLHGLNLKPSFSKILRRWSNQTAPSQSS